MKGGSAATPTPSPSNSPVDLDDFQNLTLKSVVSAARTDAAHAHGGWLQKLGSALSLGGAPAARKGLRKAGLHTPLPFQVTSACVTPCRGARTAELRRCEYLTPQDLSSRGEGVRRWARP